MMTHPSNRWHPVRILLNNIRWSLMDYKFKSEEALKDSGVSWTVVRPGGLTTGERGQAVIHAGESLRGVRGRGGCIEAWLVNPARRSSQRQMHHDLAVGTF
jgi:hypothetical protein